MTAHKISTTKQLYQSEIRTAVQFEPALKWATRFPQTRSVASVILTLTVEVLLAGTRHFLVAATDARMPLIAMKNRTISKDESE